MRYATNAYFNLGTRFDPGSLSSTVNLGTQTMVSADFIVVSGTVDDPFTGRSRLTPQTVLARAWPVTDLRTTPRT